MKIGVEDKKKVIIMSVLLILAIFLFIYEFGSTRGNSSSPVVASSPATAGPTATPATPNNKKTGIFKTRERTLNPTLQLDRLAASEKIEYSGATRNIFRMAEPLASRIPPVDAPVVIKSPGTIIPPPPPPEIPLKYYGFSNRPGEPKKAFLQDGDNIFVASEGDVVERRYKIVKITNNSVVVEDVLNNNQQSISLRPPQTTG
jgi:hypothetical protein